MIYIEDLIDRLACFGQFVFLPAIDVSMFDQRYLDSFVKQNLNDAGLTEKQRKIALSIISKYSAKLQKEFNIDINELLKFPQFRLPVRVISADKEITILENRITVKFPYDQTIIDSITKYKKTLSRTESSLIGWHQDTKTWVFPLTENSISFLSGFNGFKKDEMFLELSTTIETIKEHIENHAPMLSFDNGTYVFKNASDKIPNIETDNVVEALIHARRYGINVWDDTINYQLESGLYHETILNFLKNFARTSTISEATLALYDISDLIKFSKNVLFVIPAGSELEYLKKCTDFLKSINKEEKQISVLFRLDNQNGKEFNEYVKTQGLNNTLSDDTNFVFISSKLPKPLIESRKYFDLIIPFGNSPAHYSLRNFLRNNHNVLFMDSTSVSIRDLLRASYA